MKRIKKLASLLLAMIMVLAMTMTAFAEEDTPTDSTVAGDHGKDETFTLTIDDKTEGYTYVVYQIFKGDLSVESNGSKTLSNIEWGDSVDTAIVAGVFTKKDDNGNNVAMDAREVAESISDSTNVFDTEGAKDFAAKIAKCLNGVTVEANGDVKLPTTSYKQAEYVANTGYIFNDLPTGYYMVANTAVPQQGEGNGNYAFTRYMLEIIGNVTAKPKGEVPTPDKKIVEDDNDVIKNEASIGDEVNYKITGTMPSNIADYKTYFYKFTDTLSKGLTFKEGSFKVTVNGKDVTNYFYKEAGIYNETTGTEIEVSIEDIKALRLLTDLAVGEIVAGTQVVLTYTATLNENAVIAGDGNPNDVKLTYSNDPNNSGEGETTPPDPNPPKPTTTHPTGESPKSEVVTYTTELTILKTNQDGAFLPGVEFTLTGNGVNIVLVTQESFTEAKNGEYYKLKGGTYTKEDPITEDIKDEEGNVTIKNNVADYESITIKYVKTTSVVAKGNVKDENNEVVKTDVVGTVQADGTVTFKGLGAGTYTIKETKTLPGYNTVDDITFELTFDATETPMFKSDNDKVTVGEDNMLDTFIVNQRGSLLPSTGGIGTTIFYVVGGILVIGAGILLVAKKRMSANK